MRKIILATTAIVAMTSFAHADNVNDVRTGLSMVNDQAVGASSNIPQVNDGNQTNANRIRNDYGSSGSNPVSENEQTATSTGNAADQKVANTGNVTNSRPSGGFSLFSYDLVAGALSVTDQVNNGTQTSTNLIDDTVAGGSGDVVDNEQIAGATGNSAQQDADNTGRVRLNTDQPISVAFGTGNIALQTNNGDQTASNRIVAAPDFDTSSFSASNNTQEATSIGNAATQDGLNKGNVDNNSDSVATGSAGNLNLGVQDNSVGDQLATNTIVNDDGFGGGAQGYNNTQEAAAVGNSLDQTGKNTSRVSSLDVDGGALTVGDLNGGLQFNTADQTARNTIKAGNLEGNEQTGIARGNEAFVTSTNKGTVAGTGPSTLGALSVTDQYNSGSQSVTNTFNGGVKLKGATQNAASAGNMSVHDVTNNAQVSQ